MARLNPIPRLYLQLDIPLKPRLVAERHHNRMVREALKEVITAHHRFRIPKHFETEAHRKYGYKPRTLKYKKEKARRYHSVVDLVKTGKSKARMMASPRIVVTGSAEGGKSPVTGKLVLKFDFAGGGGRRYRKKKSPQAVLIEQMHKEIQAMTPDEKREIASQFRRAYLQRWQIFNAGRKRIRVPLT